MAFGPPPLPVYDQPICPGDGYFWTPGYWGWDADFDDYYWIPGTWVLAPEVGFFWTPPYWGWDNDAVCLFYDGYWGPAVGFYGGIDYGFGYFGVGFVGGRWDGGHFFYNRAVWNVNVEIIHNVYNERVEHNVGQSRKLQRSPAESPPDPDPQDEAAARERHVGPVAAQTEQFNAARGNPELRASANHGKPTIAATARPGDFKSGAMAAREAGGEYKEPPVTVQSGRSSRRGSSQSTLAQLSAPLPTPAMPKRTRNSRRSRTS